MEKECLTDASTASPSFLLKRFTKLRAREVFSLERGHLDVNRERRRPAGGAAIYLCKFPCVKIQPELKVSDRWALVI